ncbi:hypothetical protein EAF00_002490 [Botryotinia globosa]|nr:hypothetical protein EAF00_002490 [Botryotinia globosa]
MSQTRRQTVSNSNLRVVKVVAALRKWETDYEDEEDPCPICFESFKKIEVDPDENDSCSDPLGFNGGHGGSIVVTPCNHKFGYICLANWLLQKDSCPLCRNRILPLDPPQSIQRAQQRQRSHSTESQSSPANMQLMAPIPIARSVSLNSIMITSPFELQRWNARFGHSTNLLPEAGNLVAQETNQISVRQPPVRPSTTTHGHPATPTSTTIEPGFIRRNYNANITTYELTHRPRDNQTSHLTRPSIDPLWRNWDYTSRYDSTAARRQRRITGSVAAAIGISAGLGSVIGMPRAEIRDPAGGDNNASRRTEADNDYTIVRAMGHTIGLGTVVGMPRAEWRSTMRPLPPVGDSSRPRGSRSESANENSTETIPTTRIRETSVDEDLGRLPGLSSSMWARTWG